MTNRWVSLILVLINLKNYFRIILKYYQQWIIIRKWIHRQWRSNSIIKYIISLNNLIESIITLHRIVIGHIITLKIWKPSIKLIISRKYILQTVEIINIRAYLVVKCFLNVYVDVKAWCDLLCNLIIIIKSDIAWLSRFIVEDVII